MIKSVVLTTENHSSRVAQTLVDLFQSNALTDVTLVSDDRTVIQAHKVVLTSGSGFFKEFILNNPNPNPLIYMRGLKKEHLQMLVLFLYHGEVIISKDLIEDFLRIAKELEIYGLDENTENKEEDKKFLLNLTRNEILDRQEDVNVTQEANPGKEKPLSPPDNDYPEIFWNGEPLYGPQKKTFRTPSPVWKVGGFRRKEDGELDMTTFICSLCGTTFAYHNTTSTMRAHIKSFHKEIWRKIINGLDDSIDENESNLNKPNPEPEEPDHLASKFLDEEGIMDLDMVTDYGIEDMTIVKANMSESSFIGCSCCNFSALNEGALRKHMQLLHPDEKNVPEAKKNKIKAIHLPDETTPTPTWNGEPLFGPNRVTTKKPSPVWKYGGFRKKENGELDMKTLICSLCGKSYVYHNSPGTFRLHIMNTHKDIWKLNQEQ